jgi:hypothetical protein
MVRPCSLVSCIVGYLRSLAERMAVTCCPRGGVSRTEAAGGRVRYVRGQACRHWGSGFGNVP